MCTASMMNISWTGILNNGSNDKWPSIDLWRLNGFAHSRKAVSPSHIYFALFSFSLFDRRSDRHNLGGRYRRPAQDDPCADAHTRQARKSHSVLSKMDSRRAWSHRPNNRFDGPEIFGRRQAAELAPRFAGRLHVPRGRSGGAERSHREP
jgi:hypothetical protein